jgi:hypothetical protein
MRLKAILIGLVLFAASVFVIWASFALPELGGDSESGPVYEAAFPAAITLVGSVFLIVWTVKDFRRHRATNGEVLSDIADLLN